MSASRRCTALRRRVSDWKRKYGGLAVNEARRLRVLEEENARLKRLVAEQALDVQALRDVLAKNF